MPIINVSKTVNCGKINKIYRHLEQETKLRKEDPSEQKGNEE